MPYSMSQALKPPPLSHHEAACRRACLELIQIRRRRIAIEVSQLNRRAAELETELQELEQVDPS